MSWIVRYLWLVPALPIAAAGATALVKRERRKTAASLSIGSMCASLALAVWAFVHVLGSYGGAGGTGEIVTFRWLQFGNEWCALGWVLDPLSGLMLLVVGLVALLVMIYSTAYMSHDANFTRFFCFLDLFCGAMFGVILADSFLLLFMCWEVMGLTSYLLIGFWYSRPSAAAAAKKAFLVTRVGDLAFFAGLLWLYGQTGTLLLYDHGAGCMESLAATHLAGQITGVGVAVSTGIALLIFCGAAGKSGQVPLHVWLPDAMEGPTPVSALIHAATMVAAGVFLVARTYPLLNAHGSGAESMATGGLVVVVWVGAITSVFGAVVAVAQYDIKRILAYSTISQLGYMMMGLGVGGPAVGMFHLVTHALFKALLFLGAGSVIHSLDGNQDIRKMGGMKRWLPITFGAYGVGMLALCGVPPFFSGFWSKDAILSAAYGWNVSRIPFYLGLFGAFLTAFYMTRQMYYIFSGRLGGEEEVARDGAGGADPHESELPMTVPLILLAALTLGIGLFGTPAWPWIQGFLDGTRVKVELAAFKSSGVLVVMAISSLIVFAGLAMGWTVYGRGGIAQAPRTDPLERFSPGLFRFVQQGFLVDALFTALYRRVVGWGAGAADVLDRRVWGGAVQGISSLVRGAGGLDSRIDSRVVNASFDEGCEGVSRGGKILAMLQGGQVQRYMMILAGALIAMAVVLLWGARA